MRSIYILFISLLVSFSCFAKKQYVFEPKYQVNNTSSFSDTIYISISDDRVFTDKVKEKFTSEQLIDTIFNIVNKAFPNCVILRESDSETNVNKITFRIHIETYQVEFNRKIKAQDLVITPLITGGSSRWVGTTDYKVEILERRIIKRKQIQYHFMVRIVARIGKGPHLQKKFYLMHLSRQQML